MKSKIHKIGSIFIFLPLMILVGSDAALVLVNQVPIMVEFGITNNFTLIGAIIAVSLVSHAICMPIFGYLADKYQRKWILISGAGVWALAEFAVYYSPRNIYIFMMFRIIGSGAAASQAPVTMSLLSDIFSSEKRGNSFAWWGLATTIGSLGGGLIGTAFNPIFDDTTYKTLETLAEKIAYIETSFSMSDIVKWRIPFLIMAAGGIFFTILIFFVKEPKRGSSEKELEQVLADENVDYSKSYRIKLEDLRYIYTRKSNFWLIINWVDTVTSGIVTSFLITWITLEVGLSFEAENLLIAIPYLLILVGFMLFGQFYFSKRGDKMVQKGDRSGRVKMAILCGVANIPALLLGFIFYPNFVNKTFFRGAVDLSANPWLFYTILIIMAIILGIGFAFVMGIAPNWYSSMLDVNLPEHRGTMIATAAFLDSIGRAIGSWFGGFMIDFFTRQGSPLPISDTIVFSTLTFGIVSALLWLPIYKHSKKDFNEIAYILENRARKLKKQKE
ncbi:MAG: MFS transporter [Candidatus Lokiarchaeota archaeon]|nr:MFS transporter [Candidatus Lokiarchaeota archaeon]